MDSVSVIIPLFNRADLVMDTLASLSSEFHPGVSLEVIVVDDGSTDHGPSLIKERYPHVVLLQQSNQGAPTARNYGLSFATGEFVVFLDSDDLISPDFFRSKVSALKSNQHVAAAYGPWELFMDGTDGSRVMLPRHTPYPIELSPSFDSHLERLLGGWYIICHAILWRKVSLLQLGGYSANLQINQDVDLLFRALVDRFLIVGVESPTALYRSHSGERVGADVNIARVEQIYSLRLFFVKELEERSMLNSFYREALGCYCFDAWKRYRVIYPSVAEKFYELGYGIWPDIKLRGGLIYRILGRLLGARNAFIIKSIIGK